LNNDPITYETFSGFPNTDVFLLTENSVPRITSPQLISSESLYLTTCSPAAFYPKGNLNRDNASAVKITIGALNGESKVKFHIDYFDN